MEEGTVLDASVQSGNENTPLLKMTQGLLQTPGSWFARRYNTARVCVSSRSAVIILLWSFVLGLWNGVALNPDLYLRSFVINVLFAGYGFVAMMMCFSPLAGILADIRYGRFKAVVGSVILVLITEPLVAVVIVIVLNPLFGMFDTVALSAEIILSIVGFVLLTTSYISLVIFTANVIQFGMDQLHDSPGEDRTLFIHWYVWVYYLSIFIGQLAWNLTVQLPYNMLDKRSYYNIIGYCMLGFIPVSALLIVPATLFLTRRRRQWFLIEPGQYNPYKLVYRITKFARQHKVPVSRSAFTYCEDEVPAGLDLAKEKYGGNFTTEQVEDVKVFYGILKILFSFGTVFFMDFAASSVLPIYALHTTPFTEDGLPINGTLVKDILLKSGLLSPLLTVVCIPVYLWLLRSFISRYVPGMLKRMGLAMLLTLLSLVVSFTMDIIAHSHTDTTVCMFAKTSDYGIKSVTQTSLLLIIQLTLSALSHMLIYIGVFEFICSQSPHPMKGLLIGLFYAIKGLNQFLATLLVVPVIVKNFVFPISCGFFYYLVNILLGVIAVLIFVWAVKTYRYRERDEPSNIHRYAEEYYSNPNQEQYYDYD